MLSKSIFRILRTLLVSEICFLGIFLIPHQDWEPVFIINLNLYGVINGINIIYPIMVKQKFGNIINTSSIGGIIPFPNQVLYNTTKYAISGLTLSLYKEAKAKNLK